MLSAAHAEGSNCTTSSRWRRQGVGCADSRRQQPVNPPTRDRLPLWFLLANWLLVLAAFLSGFWLGRSRDRGLPEPEATAMGLIVQQILESHVDPQDPHDLADRALHGMVDSLDEYSQYIEPQLAGRFDEDTTGVYDGIGVVSVGDEGRLLVRFPMAGGPAERAGLQPGDRFVAVDGSPIADFPVAQRGDEANKRLRGEAGTKVRVLMQRGESPPFEVELVRGPIQKSSLRWVHLLDAEKGLGYVRISDFQQETAAELQAAIAELQGECPNGLHGLCIDLRWNGGGLLDQCVAVARLFLAKGNIVTTRHRGSVVADQTFDAEPAQCRYPDLPLALLVNHSTASACEVLAGALQDHGRATIVGTRTYGKGVVNTIYTWRNMGFRLKLTTARYFTPNGRNLDRPHDAEHRDAPGGIEPDHVVALDQQVQEDAYARLESGTEVPKRFRAAVAALEQRLALVRQQPLGPEGDAQLAAAMEQLRQTGGTPR